MSVPDFGDCKSLLNCSEKDITIDMFTCFCWAF